jgi:hypothetical protein
MSSGYPNYAFSLTVEENLKFYGRLYGLRGASLQRKVDEVTAFLICSPMPIAVLMNYLQAPSSGCPWPSRF